MPANFDVFLCFEKMCLRDQDWLKYPSTSIFLFSSYSRRCNIVWEQSRMIIRLPQVSVLIVISLCFCMKWLSSSNGFVYVFVIFVSNVDMYTIRAMLKLFKIQVGFSLRNGLLYPNIFQVRTKFMRYLKKRFLIPETGGILVIRI